MAENKKLLISREYFSFKNKVISNLSMDFLSCQVDILPNSEISEH